MNKIADMNSRRSSLGFLVVIAMSAAVLPVSGAGADSPHDNRAQMDSRLAAPGLSLPGGSEPARASMLATRPTVPLEPCADDPAWLCGSVRVPVDRAHPYGRTIGIGFNVFPHTDPASSANDAVFVSDGGPGAANATADGRGFRLFQFEPLTGQRDLVLIDNRGTGTSSPIRCPWLQHGVSGHDAYLAAVGACGARLGRDADRYGSGDVALDVEAVRRALGYRQINYYAQSYGTVDIQAYGVRFPHRLRTVVADAGFPVSDPAHVYTWGRGIPRGLARTVGLTCRRAPACAAAQPDAGRAVAQLARMVRRDPVEGMVRDAEGKPRRVKVTEVRLIGLVRDQMLNAGELAAAADALAAEDSKPLLRLGFESSLGGGGGPEDPAVYSEGDNAAAFCNDNDFVWDRSDPVRERRITYQRALQNLRPDAFAPFSRRAWAAYYLPDYCLRWPAPDRFTPAVPRGATVTGVPTLVLSGDLDPVIPTETTRPLLRVFRGAKLLQIAGAAHPAAGWSECARTAMHGFIRRPHRTVGRCDDPAYVAPAVSRFPRTAAGARAAAPRPDDQSTRTDHRVVTVAVRAALDAWLRSFRIPGDTGTGRGLRGGDFIFDYARFDDRAVIRLNGVRFSRDVVVRGRTTWTYETNTIRLHVTTTGPRGRSGRLSAVGRFGFGAPYSVFDVTGAFGPRTVHVRVPAN